MAGSGWYGGRYWPAWHSHAYADPNRYADLGASLATQSGLLFFAGTQDFYLRAFDTATGKEIWKDRLPVGSQSGPMTYVSPKTGKQYIIINAGVPVSRRIAVIT